MSEHFGNGASHGDHDNSNGENTSHITALLDDLRNRTRTLLSELELFKQHLRETRQEQSVETAHYYGTIKSEMAMLERLSQKEPEQSSYHIAKSSNLPFLEKVWNTVKCRHGLVALQKRVYFTSNERPAKAPPIRSSRRRRGGGMKRDSNLNASCIVDAIVDSGLTWIKISLVNNNRILFDLAKQGWELGSSGSDSELEGSTGEEADDLQIVKTAKDLAEASQCARIRTKRPSVLLMLPRIIEGETEEVDRIIAQCRATGVAIICGENSEEQSPAITAALHSIVPDPFDTFSDVLNIDCTILLAIVSEFSHAKVLKEPWFHPALKRQVEIEGNENLLPSMLYPAMGAHRLVCTREAAKRMHEIVDTIGTVSEKARTAIMMGVDKTKSRQELIQEMQKWSAHEVPLDWKLPIEVVDQNENDCQNQLPNEAHQITAGMTAINKSIFLYGWATGRTTISSNRTVVKQIEHDFDRFEDLDDAIWPKIWLCPTARSLVGKEKRGAIKGGENKDGAWPLPDPLRRENQRRNGLDMLTLREGHDVVDLRPNGYDYTDVLDAKNAASTY